MHEEEKILFYNQLENCTNYLEFGSGESTISAVKQNNISSIVSVEADFEFWNKLVDANVELQAAIETYRLIPLTINIGKTGEWSYPLDSTEQHNYPNYSSIPFNFNRSYDLVLIDGRFRVACGLHCCLDLADDTTILIHDFPKRKQYHLLLNYLNFVEKVNTLYMFKTRSYSSEERQTMQILLERYQYKPEC